MKHEQLKERHLKPATPWGEFVRNRIGSLVNRTNLTIEGLENVENFEDGDGAIIVVAPHNGHVDTILVRMAFDKDFRKFMFAIAAGDYWERIGWKQIASSLTRIVSISREGGDQAFSDLEQIAQFVENGERVIIFPEGTRSRDPETPIQDREFKTGLGLLALMTQGKVPIIPVFLEGNEKIMPPGKMLPEFKKDGVPHDVNIKIGKPIDLSSYLFEPMANMSKAEISKKRKIITRFLHEYFVVEANDELFQPENIELKPY